MKKIYLLFTLLFLISTQVVFATVCDLQLKKDLKSAPFFKGDTIVYRLALMNNGTDTVFSVDVNDDLPSAFLQFQDDSLSSGYYDPFSQVWTIDTIAPGATAFLYVKAVVLQNQRIKSVARVIGAVCTPEIADSISFSAGLCNLTINKQLSAGYHYVGDTILFTVKLKNPKPDSIFSISVEDLFPSQLTFVSDSTSPHSSFNSLTQIWSIDTLASNDSTYLYVKAKINTGTVSTNNTVNVKYASCYSGAGQSGGGGGSSGASCGRFYAGCFGTSGAGGGIASTVTIPVTQKLSIGMTDGVICSGTTKVLNPLVSGGVAPYSYAWSPNGPSITTPGAYTVTVTDTDGKTLSKTVNITSAPSPLTPTLFLSKNIACVGEQITITTGVPGTATWSAPPPAGTPFSNPGIVFPIGAGAWSYHVVISDANGCTVSANSPVLTVNMAPTVTTSGSQNICQGAFSTLSANVSGGTTPYIYDWSPLNNNLTPANASNPTIGPATISTNYTIKVTDNKGCTATANTFVNVNSLAPILTFSKNPICLGETTTINTSIPGTAVWASNSSGTPSGNPGVVTPNAPGAYTYIVTVTNSSGCTSSAMSSTLIVNDLPVANVTPGSKTICPGSSYILGEGNTYVSGGTSPFSFAWSAPETSINNPAGNISSEFPTVKPAVGSYNYVVTVSDANGCSATSSVTVSTGSGISVNLFNDQTCEGTAYTLNPFISGGSGIYTYNWSPSNNGMDDPTLNSPTLINPTVTTTYSVSVTDNNGCMGSSDAVITINGLPVGTATDNLPSGVCSGGTTDIFLTADITGTSFTWVATPVSGSPAGNGSGSGNSITEVLTNSSNSIPAVVRYTITPTGPGSCNGATFSIDVTIQPLTDAPVVSPFITYCQDAVAAPLTASGNSLTWYDQSLSVIGSVAPIPSTSVTGTTNYYVTDTQNGCQSQASQISVFINPKDDASFSYPTNTFCRSGGSVVFPSAVATSGGTFTFTTVSGGGINDLGSFDPATGSFDLSGTDAGKYRVKYETAGTCIDTFSVLIAVTDNFDASFSYNGPYCEGSPVSALPTFTSGTAGMFSANPLGLNFVSTATGEIDLSVSVAGTYTVTNTIAASGSCSSASAPYTLVINPLPVADAGLDTAFCQGASGMIGRSAAANNSYTWTSVPAGAMFSPSDLVSNPTVSPTTTTTFTLNVTDVSTGCANTNSIIVYINPLPTAPIVTSLLDYCAGDLTFDLSLSVNAGSNTITYYGPNSTTANLGVTAPTPSTASVGTDTYYVTQTDIAGCTGPQATIVVNTNVVDAAVISYTSAQYCSGATVNPIATIAGKTGGTFSIVPAVTGFDVMTGEIPLTNTTAGQCYTVTYNTAGTSGICHTTASAQVCIVATPSANFTYGNFCKDTINVLPVISSGSLTGGTFKLFPASQTGIDVDSTSGAVNLSGFPSTYTIRHFIPYNTTTGCPSSLFDSTITIKPLPLAVIADTTMRKVCYQSSIVLKADAFISNSSYLWLKNGVPTTITADSITVDSTGVYSVVANTLTCGSDTSYTVNVVVNKALSLAGSVVADVNCFGGSDGAIQAYVTGGTLPYSFSWNTETPSKKDNVYSLSTGTYTVTVTDGFNCQKVDSFTVGEPASQLAAYASATQALCYGQNNGSASVFAYGGTGSTYTYKWSDTTSTYTTAAISNIKAGIYVVTVSDSRGCSVTSSAEVMQPNQISVTSKTVPASCNGASDGKAFVFASGGSNSGFTYQWLLDGSSADSLVGLKMNKYIVQISDNATTGCSVNDTIQVTQPPLITLATTVTDIKCKYQADGAIKLNANGGNGSFTFKWNAADSTSQNLKGLAPGTYTVVATDIKGCTKSRTVTVIEPALALKDTMTHSDIPCSGGTNGKAKVIVTGGTSPYKYLWSNSIKNDSLANVPNGNYTVSVTDANGCTVTDFVNIIVPSPIVTATYAKNANPGSKDGKAYVNVQGGQQPYAYLWNDSLAQTNDTLTGVRTGTYTVKVTDANGCYNFVSVFIDENITGISDIALQNSVSVYPNPNEGLFMVTISQDNIKVSDIKIYSVEGAIVYDRQLNSFDKLINTAIDLNKFSAGIYYMQVNTNAGMIRKKVVVQK